MSCMYTDLAEHFICMVMTVMIVMIVVMMFMMIMIMVMVMFIVIMFIVMMMFMLMCMRISFFAEFVQFCRQSLFLFHRFKDLCTADIIPGRRDYRRSLIMFS